MFISKEKALEDFIKLNPPKPTKRSIKSYLNWKSNNPHKIKAHRLVFSAIRNGKLKSKPCFVCGENKTDAHHDDYSKPLEVIWLCHLCHGRRHKEIKLSTVLALTDYCGKNNR